MHKCFGVDIGNSGVRVAELKLAENELGSMLRIDWCYEDWNAAHRCFDSKGRYLPGDPAWLEVLKKFVAGTTAIEPASKQAPSLWLISSVRRDAQDVLQCFLQSCENTRIRVMTYRSLPLEVNVQNPALVGIDRLLAALAAIELTAERPLVVVQAGSAVTIDLVTSCQKTDPPTGPAQPPLAAFAGGAILPGVPMMLRLLGKAADMLPEVDADDLIDLPELPGTNTEKAMICGTASALVGGVSHLIARYREQFGPDLPVVLSGGDGMRLSPYLQEPLIVASHLVHRGLLGAAQLLISGEQAIRDR